MARIVGSICWIMTVSGALTAIMVHAAGPNATAATVDSTTTRVATAVDGDSLAVIRGLITAGRIPAAEALARGVLARLEVGPEPDSLRIADVMDALVESLLRAGKARDPESKRLAERALAIRENVWGPEHPDVARALNNLGSLHRANADLARARPLYERALAIRERAMGPAHPDLAKILNNLGLVREAAGDPAGARSIIERALAIQEKALGTEHPELALTLGNLALMHRAQGDYAGAMPLSARALAIREKALGPEHPDVAASLINLAILRYQAADYQGALSLSERALAIQEKALGPDHPELASGLHNLAAICDAMGNYARARPLSERALAIREKALGPDHPEVGQNLNNLAILHMTTGDRAGARPLYERALAIKEKALGPEHPDVALTLNNLAELYRDLGDYAAAGPLLVRAVTIWEEALGPDHPSVAQGLHNLASYHRVMGDYVLARSLSERALAIRERTLGPNHPDMAASLNNLANQCYAQGDYAGAWPLYERAVATQEKTLGPDHPDVGKALNGLANLHRAAGEYARAMPLSRRALKLQEKALGADHPDIAQGLVYLASLHQVTGDHDKARTLYERALAIQEKALGPEHPDQALTLTTLANLYSIMGDHLAARRLHQRGLAILEKALGPGHAAVAAGLQGLAGTHIVMRDYRAAQPLLERALAIQEKSQGPQHPDVAASAYNLASVYGALGDTTRMRPLLERAVATLEKALGREHPSLALSLSGTAALEALAGQPAAALRAALRAESIGRTHFQRTAERLSEREALRYAAVRAAGLNVALSLVGTGQAPGAAGEVLDAVILSRALVLDELAARHHRTGSTNPTERNLRQRLAEASAGYAKLVVRGPDPAFPRRFRGQLDQAREAQEAAERALAEASVPYRRARTQRRAGLAEVSAALPSSSALVAFVRYGQLELVPAADSVIGEKQDPVPSYLAFVLGAGSSEPQVVTLGSAAEVDSLVGQWQAMVEPGAWAVGSARAERRYRPVAAALRERVWDPIAALLAGAERVFVVPEGSLNLVSLGALPVGESGYLIETGPLVHYVSAERDLVVEGREGVAGTGLLAVGGPAYDAVAASAPTAVRAGPGPASYRGARAGCGEFGRLRFAPLPASRREVEEIAASWQRWGAGGAARPLSGAAASEAAFKREAPGQRVLHVATHGFFLGGRCPSALEGRRGIGGLVLAADSVPAVPGGDSPLLLSGLALAGANQRGRAGAEEEDGILTAEEIGAMDLAGVEWAVLSACGSGVGEVRAGEGVFGLRRAFQVAGARTLIMSLWAVGDEPTRVWMGRLYQARLERGMGTAEAVSEASLGLLRAQRAKGMSTHPFHWGAFVAAGDWR